MITMHIQKYVCAITLLVISQGLTAQQLTPENIKNSFHQVQAIIGEDTLRPAFHLTPPAGCMGDPNGGIYFDGWYHIFYGLYPFAGHPGGWYWAHAKSQDLLYWDHLEPGLTPAFDLGLNYIGSGSTIAHQQGLPFVYYSASSDDQMKFWQAQFTTEDLNQWTHLTKNPILTLDHPGLPDYDDFWRDPFVFEEAGRTFMIACADLLEEDVVSVPIFEATDAELSSWAYKGTLFDYPKNQYRNFEVPEIRKIGDQWVFMASVDAPVDRCIYFTGQFEIDKLRFTPEQKGVIDYSGHYYAQESILDSEGNIVLMAWIPGWDRDWLPTYMNEPLKNDGKYWNGCFAIPRNLTLNSAGELVQHPVKSIESLRGDLQELPARQLPVEGPMTSHDVLETIHGDQLELQIELALGSASFCGLNLLCDKNVNGCLFIIWNGNELNVDGVKVPIEGWQPNDHITMQIFIDKQIVEIFVNGGKYCVSRKVRAEHIKGDRISLTRLGGTARLISLQAWPLRSLN